MTEEYRQAVQEHREALAALNTESENYVANLSDTTMDLPESFQEAIRKERTAYQKLFDLTHQN